MSFGLTMLAALGGAIGAAARFGVVSAWRAWSPDRPGEAAFPWGTLAVNLLGCAAIGLLAACLPAYAERPAWRVFWLVGVLGGFTTFSSFAHEVHELLAFGRAGAAVAYVAGSLLGGLALAWVGWRAAGGVWPMPDG